MVKTKHEVANLICHMIERDATEDEMMRIVKYSIAVMDSSSRLSSVYEELSISELETKYKEE